MQSDTYIPCPYCKGTGRVKHECERYDLEKLKTLYQIGGPYSGSESLCIHRCRVCGQPWKIRWQYDPGSGRDDIWLKPGECKRGYSFTEEEAEEVMREVKQSE